MSLPSRERLCGVALAALWAAFLVPGGAGAQEVSMPPLRTAEDLADPTTLALQRGGAGGSDVRLQAPSAGKAPDAAGADTAGGGAATPAQARDPAPIDDASATPPKPPSFNLFSGPSNDSAAPTLATQDFNASAAGPANTAAKPAVAVKQPGAVGSPTKPALDAKATAATKKARANGLPVQPNPTLTAGVADETLPADSLLRTNRPTEAIDRILRPKRKAQDPFAAVGIRAGTFILYPQLIQTLGLSSNIDATAGGKGGAFTETTVSTRLLSDWSMNEAEINSTLTYRRNFAGETRSDPDAALDGRLRLDLSHDTVATLRGAVEYKRENASDISDSYTTTQKAGVVDGSVSAELSHDFTPITLTGTATAARESYTDLPGGGTVNDNYTTLTTALRTSYDLSPALKPFIEASIGRRLFDTDYPSATGTLNRNAWIPALRAGVSIDVTEKIRGEIAAGYAWKRPDDPAAERTSAPTVDANLVWSAQRGTDVTLSARTTFEPEPTGASTTTSYQGAVGIRQQAGERTNLTAVLRAQYKNSTLPANDETLLTGEAGFTYWFNRSMALTGLYSHSQDFSQVKDASYHVDTVSLGVKLQR
ncbi:outer membrane beta-barrel protein [Jiella sp. M17.18]|uniref:outer membrane beta-barrel protein n=1 Tax=Jiella sp. M17.18 TaxID=3234247 RepID=UPI0034E014C8